MDQLADYGVAVVLTILVLREVFAFLGKRKQANGDDSGAQPTDYWRRVNREVANEALRDSVLPILNKQTDIIARLEQVSSQAYEKLLKQEFLLEQVDKSLGLLRQSNHVIVEHIQKLVNHAESSKLR